MAESPTPFAEIDHGPSKLDQFLDAHQKKLIIAAILLALGMIAYVIYSGIAKGKAEEAGAALLTAESAEDYQKVISQWPESKAASTALPLLADLQGEDSPTDAIQTLNEFIDNNPNHPAKASAQVSLALRMLEEGKTEDASTLLTEIAENESDSYIAPLACITLGDIAKAAGKKEEASTWYKKAQADEGAQGNTFSQAAAARLALVNAEPPTKIQPAPPAPVAPPAPPAPAVTPAPPAPVTPPVEPTATPTPTPGEAEQNNPAEKQKTESEASEAP
ncbi:tetratricopeptide repeat protein [Verrucomicrobiaceae bacterium N1E253]|uniref:Tetratricopeptide repeat protein n=1 Tax=Oceaniferula marina TaxID=2748318 RepID=A0A851GP84_9BACT|nr:tetratricopeptide repeat protein [Oceaniferula marina]NWK56935.1 tetratricopeptide repeat protein [Oceaniferula marina]